MTERLSSLGEVTLAEGAPQCWLLPSAVEMARLDHAAISRGTTGLELMERAGLAIAECIAALLPAPRRCVVLCGPGNNGGDGLVIGRTLREHGFLVDIVLSESEHYSAECSTQLSKTSGVRVCQQLPVSAVDHRAQMTLEELDDLLERSELVIDALLGTGLREAPRGAIKTLVERLNAVQRVRSKRLVVSVDLPTGLDADTGRLFEPHVRADRSITVQFVKRGMLQFPGRSACGFITAVPIGIEPDEMVEYSLITEASGPSLAPRAADVHKGALGRVVVVGGSLAMPGAPMLSSLGALRAGAGIVTRVVRRTWHNAPALPEAMFEILDGDSDFFTGLDAEAVLSVIRRHDVVVLGPGLGVRPETEVFVHSLLHGLRGTSTAVVLDADALNLIAARGQAIAHHETVLTPHPGEAARLLGVTSVQIQSDRFAAVRMLAQRYAVPVVLKGAGTLVHNGSRGRLIADGSPYLATPGSGDVLAGIIAACVARTGSIYDAASLGSWIHARAGCRAAHMSGGTILASDIAHAAAALCG